MIIHYEYFNGIEQNIWLYFVNRTGKSIEKITWVVKVNGVDDELELNCREGYSNSDEIHRCIFTTKYKNLDYGGVKVIEVIVTFSNGDICNYTELKEDQNLRRLIANAEFRHKPVAYYEEPMQFGLKEDDLNKPKDELKKDKKKKIIWGIIFLFIFWPIGAFLLYEAYQISKEIGSK